MHVITAFTDTLLTVLDGRGTDLPFWRMATIDVDELRGRAATIVEAVGHEGVIAVDTAATPGGGTLPDVEIPSAGVRVVGDVRAALRGAERPLVARSDTDDTVVDLRTVDPVDDAAVIEILRAAVA